MSLHSVKSEEMMRTQRLWFCQLEAHYQQSPSCSMLGDDLPKEVGWYYLRRISLYGGHQQG